MKMIKQPTIPPMPKRPTFDARDTQYNLPIDTDLISRAEAIDALSTITMYKGGIPFDTAVMRIKQLPPIQPEIIRCKDCKHFEYDHPYIIQGIPVLGHEVCNAWGDGCKTDENGYCFMAERRTDEQTD